VRVSRFPLPPAPFFSDVGSGFSSPDGGANHLIVSWSGLEKALTYKRLLISSFGFTLFKRQALKRLQIAIEIGDILRLSNLSTDRAPLGMSGTGLLGRRETISSLAISGPVGSWGACLQRFRPIGPTQRPTMPVDKPWPVWRPSSINASLAIRPGATSRPGIE